MAATARTLGGSLGGRLFLMSGGLVLGAMAAAIGFTAWRAGQVADQWVSETLAASSTGQAGVERQRLGQLRLLARFVASDPSFAAYVAEADPTSVRDLLLERQREVACDFMAVLDPRGRVVARTDRAGAAGEDLSSIPVIDRAMDRGEAMGLLSDGGRYWTATAVPIFAGQEALLGLLVAGLSVDDPLALEVRRGSGAEVAYVALEPEPRVIASTLGENRELLRAIARHAGAASAGPEPARLSVDGHTWVVRSARLDGGQEAAPSAVTVVTITLASLDQVLAPFRRIERVLVLVGVLSLLGAFAISWALSRSVTRPLAALADAADGAREGRYDLPLPTAGHDELGRLARAFKSLLAELREQRETEAYLGSMSRSLPEAPAGADRDALPVGAVIADRFEVVARIGGGGFGTVYRAHDRQLQDTVALKTLRPGTGGPEALDSLKEELRIARRITHRNVLRTHDFGEADGMAFISMEFVRGITLRELLDHAARPPLSVMLRLARQLLAGVDAAHRTGVVHRDLKPANVILDPTGLLRIMDFGIARAARARGGTENGLVGTPGYLAPEQLAGEAGDVRSDLYACGTMLYEMLAARRPFAAVTYEELAYRVTNEDPPDLMAIAPATPPELARAVMRCLARDPAARWASAADLLEALAKVEG